ncbi:MAG TPA: NAD(P)H-hydrate epimerase, partial [Nitrospirales bacterium]
MELVTAAEMRELDRAAIEGRKIPSLRLMEDAGKAVAGEMERCFGPLRGKTVTIVSGKGQNGGDGLVVARLLRQKGCKARVALLAAPSALKGDAAANLKKFQRAGGRCLVVEAAAKVASILSPLFQDSDLLVDAIFGTGLNAPV